MYLRLVFHESGFDFRSKQMVASTIQVLVLVPTKRCQFDSKSQELDLECKNLVLQIR
jgi:hypothetical protein